MSGDPGNTHPEIEALKVQVQGLQESERRLMDTVKVAAGLMLGLSAVLVVFAWFSSHKNYEQDKLAIQKALESTNETRFAAFNRDLDGTLNARLNAVLTAREQAMDRKLAETVQALRVQMSATGGVSSNQLAQQSEEVNRKILLMVEVIENRHAHAFGLTYFDNAIRAVNAKQFPAGADYFLSAALAFARSREDAVQNHANLTTALARLNQFGFQNLKTDDFAARPGLEDKFAQLLEALEKANGNGRFTVALADARREFADAKRRSKTK
jgi:hypothetical protein